MAQIEAARARLEGLSAVSPLVACGTAPAGKTVLLKLIVGLLDRPDGGSLSIGGDEIATMSDHSLSARRNEALGFVFQFHFLLQDFTALENVMIPMRRLGIWSDQAMRARAHALLEAVGLEDKAARSSRALSGGAATCMTMLPPCWGVT